MTRTLPVRLLILAAALTAAWWLFARLSLGVAP